MKFNPKNSYLGLIAVFLMSCSLLGDDADKENLTSKMAGSYKVTYASTAFTGSTDVTIRAVSDDEIEITPGTNTGHPIFKAKVFLSTDDDRYGLKVTSQVTDKGTMEGRVAAGAEFCGAFRLSDKVLAYTVKLTNNNVVDEIAVVSNGLIPAGCSDGIKNGDETGVDCGGSCSACAATSGNAVTSIKTASSEQFWSVGFYDDKVGIIAANATVNSSIYKTSDGGATWVPIKSPSQSYVRNIIYTSASDVYLNTDTEIYFSNTAGLTWEKTTTIPVPFLGGIFYKIDNSNWVIGRDYNQMKYSTDAGVTWNAATINKGTAVEDIFPQNLTHFPTSTIGYTIFSAGGGARYVLYKTLDAGKSWTYVSQPVTKYVTGMHFTDENTGFVVGSFNEILKTTDGGKNWSVAADMGFNNTAGIYLNGNKGIVIGNKIMYTIDGGANWKASDAILPGGYTQLKGVGSNAYAVSSTTAIKIDLTKLK